MSKNSILLIILLTLAWSVLNERQSVFTLLVGIVLSTACVYYCHKFLPLSTITGVNFLRLLMYPFYLIGQIYLAGFHAIKLILTGGKVSIVEIKTELSNDFLKVILVNSITLIPGTVSLGLNDETITVLWLRRKTNSSEDNAEDILKGNLEKKLLKAQR